MPAVLLGMLIPLAGMAQSAKPPTGQSNREQDRPAQAPDASGKRSDKPNEPTGQDSGKTPGKTDPPAQSAASNGKRQPAPLPTNPLLTLKDQTGQTPASSPQTGDPKNFGDYRQTAEAGVVQGAKAALPVFGYDFFQPARDLILARRAFLKRKYQTGKPTEDGKDSQPKQDEPATAAQSGGQEKQDRQDKPDNLDGVRQATPQPGRTVTLPDGSTIVLPGANPTAAAKSAPASNNQESTENRKSKIENPDSSGSDSVNAFDEVADPLTQLYRNVTASVPPTYQLAASDVLTIRYWSPRHETRTLNCTIDAQGSLALEDLGVVVVRGLTMEQAEKAIRERLRRLYNGVEVSVTLGKLRTIQVTVSGAAFQPGTYTVPAVATAYNLLYAAGGPQEDGSLRGIEVRRNGKIAGTLDLYNFLLLGNKGSDIALQSGDLIYIPHRRSHVVVMGEVLQPAVFELRADETLQDALRFAGGVKASGVSQRVRINTVDPGHERMLKDVDLTKASENKSALYDGDEVEVFSVRPLIANTVGVEGAVDQPSSYALTPNMRVSDLVERARGVTGEAYLLRANLYRWNNDNTTTLITIDLKKALAHDPASDIPLERWDRLTVFTRKEVAWTGQRTVTVRGAVSRAGAYTLSDNMRVSDLLLLAGGPTPEAYLDRAVLLHQRGDGTFGLDYVNLATLTHQDKEHDVALQDNDVLAVYRTGEAQFEPEHTVTIQGEVVGSGSYPRSQGMHLSDLIKLSGGFKPNAMPSVNIAHARRVVDGPDSAVKVVSVSFNERHQCAPAEDVLLEDGDVVTVQGTGGYVTHVQTIKIQGAVNSPGPIIMTSKTMRLSDALRMAGGLRQEGFAAGAEFYRDPKMLSTDSQNSLASIIGGLNDLLNESTYNRERGKSYVDRLRAINTASQGDASPIPGGQNGAASNTNTGLLAADLAKQELVSPARKLTDDQMNANGNIAINLPEALKHPKGGDDILLADGDTITIPETPTTIQVVGAVYHGRGVLYKPGAKLDFYIAQAGGFATDAAKDRIEIIRVGGGLVPASKSGPLQPGDMILVPTRVLAAKLEGHQNGFSSFFRSLTNSAIIFKVATSLFGL